MAEEQSQEKTEQPSAKRLKELRDQGQVVRSKDFNATLILLLTGLGFLLFGKTMCQYLVMMMRQSFDLDRSLWLTPQVTLELMARLIQWGAFSIAPVLVLIFLISLFAPLLLGGWVFSSQAMQPKWSRLNALKGFQRMVSLKGLVEMVKSFLKFIFITVVAWLVLKSQLLELVSLADMHAEKAIQSGASILLKDFLLIASSLIFIVLIDVPFQWFEHHKSSRMTKQELRDEYKETEGKPEVKGAIRRAQQEIARRRMMSHVAKANVILTNPTHYAVAISYQENGAKAPIVVAKGKDLIAFQINKVAQEHRVPILSVPPLARAIYFSTPLNAEIPRGLYLAVAQVLAYIFQLRDKKYYDNRPEVLQKVPIPSELAREGEE